MIEKEKNSNFIFECDFNKYSMLELLDFLDENIENIDTIDKTKLALRMFVRIFQIKINQGDIKVKKDQVLEDGKIEAE